MTGLQEEFGRWGSRSSLDEFERLERRRQQAQTIYDLAPIERQVVMLLMMHRRIEKVARLTGRTPQQTRDILKTIMRRAGVRRHYELRELVRLTQHAWETTTALALYTFIQNTLVGATIKGAVVQDDDWCGMLLDMPDGSAKIAWLFQKDHDVGSHVWIDLDDG